VAFVRGKMKNTSEDVIRYNALAALYAQLGRGAEAVEASNKALGLVPPENESLRDDLLIQLSSSQEKAGDIKGAEETLRRVLQRNPNNHRALNNLGYVLIERNEKLPEALAMIQRAVRLEPFNSSYLDSLGWAYFKLNRLDEAERYLADAARRDASSPTIQEHLGDLHHKRGHSDQARLAWQKALSLSVEAAETSRLRAKLNPHQR
jgi:Flp pilus assembly protein TadD